MGLEELGHADEAYNDQRAPCGPAHPDKCQQAMPDERVREDDVEYDA